MQTLSDGDIDIACITESWITEGHDHTVFLLNSYGFNISHTYRKTRRGGGVAILVRNTIKFKSIPRNGEYASFEWHGIKYLAKRAVSIICVYRKQEVSMGVFLEELNELLTAICCNCSDQIILTGDFNVHFEKRDKSSIDLDNVTSNFGLQQNVENPTHIAGHMLDLIFSNPYDTDITVDVKKELALTTNSSIKFDHFPILFQIAVSKSTHSTEPSTSKQFTWRNISQVDLADFSNCIQQELPFAINEAEENFQAKVIAYNSHLSTSLDKFAPSATRVGVEKKDDLPEWFDRDYIHERRYRRRLEKLYKRLQTDEAINVYAKQRDLCITLVNSKIKTFYTNVMSETDNPSVLFKTVSKLWNKKNPKALPDHTSTKVLANKFNHQFIDKIERIRSNFTPALPDIPEEHCDSTSDLTSTLHSFEPATLDELKEIITEMKFKTSFDDPLPSALYKPLTEVLLPYILELVNLSLSTGDISGLKESTITPVLKKTGLDPNVLNNYRPITNLQFLSKLIEKVVHRRLTHHMTLNNLHCSTQFGYKKYHSTETLLLQIVDETLVGFDKRNGTVLILLDMSAAFDTVDLNKLMSILENKIGLKDTALSWFRSFLFGRHQKVKVDGVTSELLAVLYGVPQGSVLGPVLTNIYVSTLSEVAEKMGTKSSSYADDTNARIQLSLGFQYGNISVTIPRLMKQISSWMNSYFLKLNPNKTEIIFLCPPQLNDVPQLHGVFIDNQCIRFSNRVKFLSVHFDQNLNFEHHISEISSICHYHLNNIAKIKRYLSQSDTLKLMHAFITSKLDYCNCIFYGLNNYTSSKLQSIQNRAARIVLGLSPYATLTDSMLNDLHWLKLNQRIVFKILLLTHKFFMNIAPAYFSDILFIIDCEERLLNVIYLHSKHGKRSFSFCAPRYWNCLPRDIRLLNDTTKFKTCIKTVLFRNQNNIMQAALGYSAYC